MRVYGLGVYNPRSTEFGSGNALTRLESTVWRSNVCERQSAANETWVRKCPRSSGVYCLGVYSLGACSVRLNEIWVLKCTHSIEVYSLGVYSPGDALTRVGATVWGFTVCGSASFGSGNEPPRLSKQEICDPQRHEELFREA